MADNQGFPAFATERGISLLPAGNGGRPRSSCDPRSSCSDRGPRRDHRGGRRRWAVAGERGDLGGPADRSVRHRLRPGNDSGGDSGGAAVNTVFADRTVLSGVDAGHQGLLVAHEGRKRFGFPVTGQAWGDYDRDGNLDLYLTDQVGPNTLYHGEGGGRFSPSPLLADVVLPWDVSGGAGFADYDNDGWPDLFVASYGRDTLFHNDAGRGFTDVTAAAGLAAENEHGMTASWADYDDDGFLDLYVATYGCQACDARRWPRARPTGSTTTNATARSPMSLRCCRARRTTVGDSSAAGWTTTTTGTPTSTWSTTSAAPPTCPAGRSTATTAPAAAGRVGASATSAWRSGTDLRMDGMGIAVGDYDGDLHLDLYTTDTGWAHSAHRPGGAATQRRRRHVHRRLDGVGGRRRGRQLGRGPAGLRQRRPARPVRQPGGRPGAARRPGAAQPAAARERRRHVHRPQRHQRGEPGDRHPRLGDRGLQRRRLDRRRRRQPRPGLPAVRQHGQRRTGAHRLAVRLTGAGPVNRDAVGARAYVRRPTGAPRCAR